MRSEDFLRCLAGLRIAQRRRQWLARSRTKSNQPGRAAARLALVFAAVTLPAGATGPFHSPLETAAEACRKAALALHPGKVERTAVLYGAKATRIEVQIRQSDGKGWLVLCDGTSGKIVSAIDVDAP